MRFATDENFDGSILKQLFRRYPDLDIVRVQDTALYQSSDPEVLEWAAVKGALSCHMMFKRSSTMLTNESETA